MSNLSFVFHVGDDVTTQFLLSANGDDIGYLRTGDIHAYVDSVEVTFSIEIASPHIVILDVAPITGAVVLLRREMPVDVTYSDFSRGNSFGQRNMNNSFYQSLYLMHELLDGFLPAGTTQKQDMDMAEHDLLNVNDIQVESMTVESLVTTTLLVDGEPVTAADMVASQASAVASEISRVGSASSAAESADSAVLSEASAVLSATSETNSLTYATQGLDTKDSIDVVAAQVAADVSGITIEFLVDGAFYDLGFVSDPTTLFPTDLGGLT